MKASSISPQSEQQPAGGSTVVFLHGRQLELNLARAVTAEAGTFVLVLAITSTAVAAALSRPLAGAPDGPWSCPLPAAWPWPPESPAPAISLVPAPTPR